MKTRREILKDYSIILAESDVFVGAIENAMESYATQEREKAEAEKKAYAREMIWKILTDITDNAGNFRDAVEHFIDGGDRDSNYVEADLTQFELPDDFYIERWLTANGLNEPKPEKQNGN